MLLKQKQIKNVFGTLCFAVLLAFGLRLTSNSQGYFTSKIARAGKQGYTCQCALFGSGTCALNNYGAICGDLVNMSCSFYDASCE